MGLINTIDLVRQSKGNPTEQRKILSLLSKIGNVNEKGKNGLTLFNWSCIDGDFHLVKILIEEFNVQINEVNLDNQTGLHLAINNNQEEIAKYLIIKEADIFIKSSTGQNVLHYSVHYGRIDFIQWLLNYCNYDQKEKLKLSKDNDGKTALHY